MGFNSGFKVLTLEWPAQWPVYGLDDLASNSQPRKEALLQNLQTGSGARPASYSLWTEGSFFRGKAAGARSWPLASIQRQGKKWVELYFCSLHNTYACMDSKELFYL